MSLSAGGLYPGEHEFSSLEQLRKWNTEGQLDETFLAADALVSRWNGDKFGLLYMYGPPGTGKTHAAIGIARKMHEQAGATVYYKYAPELVGINDMRTLPQWLGYDADKDGKPKNLAHIFGTHATGRGLESERYRKPVLILDDYTPEVRPAVYIAVEAAAHRGGLIIMTSNHTDPFRLIAEEPVPAKSPEDILLEARAAQEAPDEMAALAERRRKAAIEISASFRSRVAAAIKFLEFSGPDHRPDNSIWG
ncbi:ATP-binding protein [Candidatus Saccharibacteria bacterium]|nr:MAG: ATP-binding protein [Candidatus Saccharibacteria bacterium]